MSTHTFFWMNAMWDAGFHFRRLKSLNSSHIYLDMKHSFGWNGPFPICLAIHIKIKHGLLIWTTEVQNKSFISSLMGKKTNQWLNEFASWSSGHETPLSSYHMTNTSQPIRSIGCTEKCAVCIVPRKRFIFWSIYTFTARNRVKRASSIRQKSITRHRVEGNDWNGRWTTPLVWLNASGSWFLEACNEFKR